MSEQYTNGQMHDDLEGLREELARERVEVKLLATEVRDASKLQYEVLKQQVAGMADVKDAIIDLAAGVRALRRSVPLEVFAWVFAVVFLLIAGIPGVRVFFGTL